MSSLLSKDTELLSMTSIDDIISSATEFTSSNGISLLSDWTTLYGELFLRLRDGYTITAQDGETSCGCNVESAPYPGTWYDRIVADTGDHYADIPDEEA
eukprot:354897_1